jgi:ribosome-associated protein
MENDNKEKSRTQNKREAEDLQKLGLELTRLTGPQLEQIDIPEKLKTAVIDAKSITSNIAGRRQRQYIGALMRDVDPERIRKALDMADTIVPAQSENKKNTRLWMDRLLDGGPEEVDAFIAVFPGQDRQRIRQLVRNAQKATQNRALKPLKTLERIISECLQD